MVARLLLLLTASCIAAPALAQPPPPRDVRSATVAGTSSITGVVISDEKQPRPLRRARVMLNGPHLAVGRTVISNDDGTFAFERLPAGRYTVGAAKDSYISMNYGARRTGRPGTGIVLGDGEGRSLTIRLPRGAVITGTVTDERGQPVAGVQVFAMARRFLAGAGESRLALVGLPASPTDDRGTYRIFGLPAGEYGIVAVPRPSPLSSDLQVLSAADVRRALAQVRDTAGRARSVAPSPPTAISSADPPRSVALAPVYYPGTTVGTQATLLKVGPGEERAAIDFPLEYAPTATVSVTVSTPDGTPPPEVTLSRTDEAVLAGFFRGGRREVDAEGRFTFPGLPPGQYTVIARGGAQPPRPADPGTPNPPLALWASTDIVVNGQDATDIALTLQPALTIAGRVVFEGSRPPPDLARLRVPPVAALTRGSIVFSLPGLQFEPGGRFTIPGILPGPYRMGPTIQGLRSPIGAWWLKSIVVSGREILDAPLDLRHSADDAVVTFSDQASELAGVVTNSQGNPVSDHVVIAFSTDKASWFFNSRRIAAVRPNADGRYTISNLPPGEYFFVVFDDIEQGEWFDPAVLQRLTEGAAKISLGEYEKKKHDIKLATER